MLESSICKRLPLTVSFDSCRHGNTHTVYSKWRHDIEIFSVLLAFMIGNHDSPAISRTDIMYSLVIFVVVSLTKSWGIGTMVYFLFLVEPWRIFAGVCLSRLFCGTGTISGIILGMRPASERRRYNVTILKKMGIKYTFYDDLTCNQTYLSNCNMYCVIQQSIIDIVD